MFPLQDPVVVLGSSQLVDQSMTFLPVSVEIIYPGALEITNFTPERLQFVMNCQNMFPEMSGVSKALVTLITHLFFDLHMKFLNVILHGIFPLEEFAALITGDGGRCMRYHVSIEIPLTAQCEAAKVAAVGAVSMDLFHVSF